MNKYSSAVAKYRIALALTGAIIVALILTVISVGLYVRSGVSSLDLSRPGFEKARDQIQPSEGNASFSANGPLNKAALQEFKALYEKELEKLSNSSDFTDQSLTDEQLRFTPETQSLPESSE